MLSFIIFKDASRTFQGRIRINRFVNLARDTFVCVDEINYQQTGVVNMLQMFGHQL